MNSGTTLGSLKFRAFLLGIRLYIFLRFNGAIVEGYRIAITITPYVSWFSRADGDECVIFQASGQISCNQSNRLEPTYSVPNHLNVLPSICGDGHEPLFYKDA